MNVLASPVQAAPWQLANPLLWYTPDRLGLAAASTIANAASAAAAVMAWTVSEVGLEDLVLAYMKQPSRRNDRGRHLEVQR